MSRTQEWIAKHFGALVAVLSFCSFSYSNAQEQTTSNLITSGTTHTWTGVTTGPITPSGGPTPTYNPSTNTISFSYNANATVAQTIAINQALANAGAGIKISGYNYNYDIRNMNYDNRQPGTDSITVSQTLRGLNNSVLLSSSQTYNTRFEWQTVAGSRTATTPYDLDQVSTLQFSMTGGDNGYWAGYYGPEVRNVGMSLRYMPDPCAVDPQSSPSCPGFRTYYTFGDDTYARVPLPFTFPFYGRTFTNSWMHSNGIVSFLDPMSPIEGGPNPGSWAYCCGGPDLSQNTVGYGAQFNYMIAPFWTDLYPDGNSQFYTTKSATNINYHWNNVPDISNNANRNTFSLELRSSGFIGATYGTIGSQQQVTIGTIGDLRLGEKTHQFFGIPSTTTIGNWSLNSTQAADCSNPLISSYCPGYAEAYLSQQCTINALYSPQCPGYATAYFTQQCSSNPLYDVNCPGYATAYYNYQCSVNPLYHTGCPGYETAYFNQQCSLNTLYNSSCPGYETAYFNQQCGLNPLYNNRCPGYADAYYVQQCTANPLYDVGCTGYQQAYFTQQCTANPLYDKTCPGYAQAYALKYVVASPTTTTSSTTTTATESITVAVSTTSDPVASAAPIVKDPVVNSVVTTTATSANPAQSATATVPLVPAPAPAATTAATVAASTSTAKEEKKTEEKKTETASTTSTTTTTTASSSDNKNEPKTTRQALAERRLEAARAKAVEEGKNLANKVGEAATMEAQVAVQNVVVQAMGFTPGFDAYGKVRLQDAAGYRPFEIYKGQRNIDSPAGRRFMTGSDRLHSEMIDQQYNLERNR